MRKRLFVIFGIITFAACIFVTLSIAQTQSNEQPNEKPLIIKGLCIGMDINDARKICEGFLDNSWRVSQIDTCNKLMDDYFKLFGYDRLSTIGKRGFLIKNKSGYLEGFGFVSDDDEKGKVTHITFSGELIDYIYSVEKVDADDFVEDFAKNFGLPNLPWIMVGWQYQSPYGYVLTIMFDKSMDIKKINPDEPVGRKKNINFH